jgi:NDP-sugar pyrophosphorylase family protein
MQALILAGGAGTRLRPILPGLNKPMAPVAGRPFLEYLLLQLKKHEINEVTLCVGYQADLIHSYIGTGERWGLRISYSSEAVARGTAGALKLAQDFIHEANFFVMNGDSLFAIDLRTLLHSHHDRKALATVALAQVEDIRRYGAVRVNERGRIVSFIEKREDAASGLINGGVYVFAREMLALIPPGRPVSLEQEILPGLVGRALYGLPLAGYFVDIGVPADYRRLCSSPSALFASVDERRQTSC